MRQVFSSARLENVEGVARLLNEQGIETYISQSRSYKGNRRATFSYADSGRSDSSQWPAVWIVRAEDQPRARELLREAGLLTATSKPTYLPQVEIDPARVANRPLSAAWVLRLRLLVLAAIAGLTLLIYRHVMSG
ncbi:MAG: pathogenicity-like protein [Lysobacterales bacterium CG17_big_fil_post_rev_8_21_14_2_50_64_11]|nr:MAG: pathogenicity-like protein [Xanthomonadales bacterium CG17_big_fil_post_rev_8_21_14_2_50_64_11]PIX60999.1 MAG: pathogenicity-like protein [Xanthomonadales bacterium CG_4_10_14_3_um_filter_64_11]